MRRHTIAARALLAASLFSACRPAPDPVSMVAADLINELPRADCRPSGACEAIAGRDGVSLRVTSPSRVTWTLPLPHDGRFETTVSTLSNARVRFRIGVSDGRVYEALREIVPSARSAPMPIVVDLSAYAGWKWSLFYHPDRIAWRLTLSSDAMGGVPGLALWTAPRVVTTRDGEAEYLRRIRGQ